MRVTASWALTTRASAAMTGRPAPTLDSYRTRAGDVGARQSSRKLRKLESANGFLLALAARMLVGTEVGIRALRLVYSARRRRARQSGPLAHRCRRRDAEQERSAAAERASPHACLAVEQALSPRQEEAMREAEAEAVAQKAAMDALKAEAEAKAKSFAEDAWERATAQLAATSCGQGDPSAHVAV